MARRGNLLMALGLLRPYFGNFSMWGEKYYFCVEGSTGGEMFAAVVRYYEMTYMVVVDGSIQGMSSMWGVHKVRMSAWGENTLYNTKMSHSKWECPHKVRMSTHCETTIQGENAHMQWECLCEVAIIIIIFIQISRIITTAVYGEKRD